MSLRRWVQLPPEDLGSSDDNYYYLLRLGTLSDHQSRALYRYLGDRMSAAYYPREGMLRDLEQYGYVTLSHRLGTALPISQDRQESDFAELLCQVTLEDIVGLEVPFPKHCLKTHPDVPIHGIDVVAFRFDTNDNVQADVLYLAQAKATSGASDPSRAARELCSEYESLTLDDITKELRIIVDHVGEQHPRYARIADFFDPYGLESKEVRLAPFIAQEEDLWAIGNVRSIRTRTFGRPLSLVVFLLPGLEHMVAAVFALLPTGGTLP